MELLDEKSQMLFEYFQIDIIKNQLQSLPLIIDGLVPDFSTVGMFLLRLALLVNWKSERECFCDISRELSMFYSPHLTNSELADDNKKLKWTIQYVIFPAMKSNTFNPQKNVTPMYEIASLHDLYKVFERC